MIPVNLATEDELSEIVLRRLLADSGRGYAVGIAYGRNGFGYLRNTISGWNRAARGVPFVLLTDLDRFECPMDLILSWLPVQRHPNLLFRIAVKEVEAWLLADPDGLAEYLGVRVGLVPENPDELPDPKAVLVGLAERSRSRVIRECLVPRRNSTAKQGPDYNACLAQFVRGRWNVQSSCSRSPSLRRAVDRFLAFTPVWGSAIE